MTSLLKSTQQRRKGPIVLKKNAERHDSETGLPWDALRIKVKGLSKKVKVLKGRSRAHHTYENLAAGSAEKIRASGDETVYTDRKRSRRRVGEKDNSPS